MTVPNPPEFSAAWAEAWNAHDVEAVLSHFHDDLVFTSPVAAQLIEASRGTLRGKTELQGHGTYLSGDENPAGARER